MREILEALSAVLTERPACHGSDYWAGKLDALAQWRARYSPAQDCLRPASRRGTSEAADSKARSAKTDRERPCGSRGSIGRGRALTPACARAIVQIR